MGETPGVSSVAFDNWFRDHLRATTPGGRAAADTASYVTMGAAMAEPLALDLYIAAGQHDLKRAGQWAIADIGGLVGGFVLNHFVLKPLATRAGFHSQRPLAGECLKNPAYDAYCTSPELTTGMPSDHSANAATGAGLTLGKVLFDRSLRKNTPLVIGTAAFGIASMLATNAGRIAADKHWTSEVLAGDTVGLTVGMGTALAAKALRVGSDTLTLTPALTHQSFSLSAQGVF